MVKRKVMKSVVFYELLKVFKKMNIDYGEGFKMKKNLYLCERGRSLDRGELFC